MNKWTLGQLGKTNPKRTQTNPTCRGVASGEDGNEPKSKKAKMNVNKVLTKEYEEMDTWSIRKNKPNLSRRSLWRRRKQTQSPAPNLTAELEKKAELAQAGIVDKYAEYRKTPSFDFDSLRFLYKDTRARQDFFRFSISRLPANSPKSQRSNVA